MRVEVLRGSLDLVSDDGETAAYVATAPEAVTLRFSGAGPERLVGLGERFVRLEQTGRRWTATVSDLLAADPEDTYHYLPLLYSSAGYAVLLHTHARAIWDLRGPGWSVAVPEPTVRVHVFRGPPLRLVQLATAVTGRPPVPPDWVLGVWKTTLSGTEAVLRQAERLRRNDIPVTACWVYDHYDEATNSGCGIAGGYPTGRYPDLPELTKSLHNLGFRALGYVQPCLFTGSAPHAEAARRGYLAPAPIPFFNPKTHPGELLMEPGGGSYVDLENDAAAAWYAGLLAETAAQGWDGWMQDMGEQFERPGDPAARNRYPLLYHRIAHSVWSDRPDFAVFARSGALGSAPYVSAMWPGDQHCDWSPDRGLPSVLPAGPSAGLAGAGAWGPDISGIVDGCDGGAGSADEELWARWCQYGALNPIMRDHLGFKSSVVDLWSTPLTTRVFRDYARLHLSLVPMLRELAREAHETGVPIVRALLLHYPEYAEAWSVPDQYLLGPDLLVAPVHVRGARSRRVWFPPGDWTSWWDGMSYAGPRWATVPAPLEQIPLFRRQA